MNNLRKVIEHEYHETANALEYQANLAELDRLQAKADMLPKVVEILEETVPCAIAFQAMQGREDTAKNRAWVETHDLLQILAEARKLAGLEDNDEES